MNQAMNDEALRALHARGYPKRPHQCEVFNRMVIQHVYGRRYDHLFRGTARLTGIAFREAGLSIDLLNGSVPGDCLFKLEGSGGDGHVGIRVVRNRVAENSSVHWNGVEARGTRQLKQYGNFDLIVRLGND
jgi:hypothetical protein